MEADFGLYFYNKNNSTTSNNSNINDFPYNSTRVSSNDNSSSYTNSNVSGNETTNNLQENTSSNSSTANDYKPTETELASFTTKIYTKDANRQNNISITCSSLNNTTVENGDTFSFCQTVGKATSSKGYQKADVFQDGEKIEALGRSEIVK